MTTSITLENKMTLKFAPNNSKMGELPNISTSSLENQFCGGMCKQKSNICSHCYARKLLKMYPASKEMYSENYKILTTYTLSKNDLELIGKKLAYTTYLRFEAYGEIETIANGGLIQLKNYCNIAKELQKYKVKCVLWSKNIATLKEYFKKNKKPRNLKIIISSYKVNEKIDLKTLPRILKKSTTFTVYSKDHPKIKERNCFGGDGSVTCSNCLICYKTKLKEIIEALRA